MTERKKKLRVTQIILLFLGVLIIFFSYGKNERSVKEVIIPDETRDKIKKQLADQSQQGDTFFNIEYSGLDLAGNRFVLKSAEATNPSDEKLVYMKLVEAIFYFKDNTILYVKSKDGIYNNSTLDMKFSNNVEAKYEGSELFAQEAEYSNSKSYLTISKNVKIKDFRGTMVADQLLFDIKKQTLNVSSYNEGKVNANLNLK